MKVKKRVVHGMWVNGMVSGGVDALCVLGVLGALGALDVLIALDIMIAWGVVRLVEWIAVILVIRSSELKLIKTEKGMKN